MASSGPRERGGHKTGKDCNLVAFCDNTESPSLACVTVLYEGCQASGKETEPLLAPQRGTSQGVGDRESWQRTWGDFGNTVER